MLHKSKVAISAKKVTGLTIAGSSFWQLDYSYIYCCTIVIFTHLKLCLADAIHNFKLVKIIQIWQNGG